MSESRMHREAKGLVADMIRRGPGHLIVSHEVDGRWESYRVNVAGLSVVVECGYPSGETIEDVHEYCAIHGRYPQMIFDVGLVRDGKVVAAVEVMKSHWIDDDKRRKILGSGVLVIGVTARSNDWAIDNVRLDAHELIVPRACSILSAVPIWAAV